MCPSWEKKVGGGKERAKRKPGQTDEFIEAYLNEMWNSFLLFSKESVLSRVLTLRPLSLWVFR